jgi:hypothetical protein
MWKVPPHVRPTEKASSSEKPSGEKKTSTDASG